MRLLIISQSIYPKTGGSSFVTENMAKALAIDHSVGVIGGSDLLWDNVSVDNRSGVEFKYIKSQLSIKYRGERFFEFLRWTILFPFNLISILNYTRRFNPDHIIVVFPDGYFMLIGYFVAARLKLPLSSYFHNTYVENRSGFYKWFAERIQKKIFSYSSRIFTMSEGLNDLYKVRHPSISKFMALPHTFFEYPTEASSVGKEDERIHVVFTGNFNQSNLDATIRLVRVLGKMIDVSIRFFTPVPAVLLKMRGVEIENIDSIKYVPESDYFKEIGKCDIVILTHGFSGDYDKDEYRTIFPTRTIPLLLSQRPIFAHTPVGAFITTFLKNNDCAEVVDTKNEDTIASAFRNLVNDLDRRRQLIVNAHIASQKFHAKNVFKDFEKILSK